MTKKRFSITLLSLIAAMVFSASAFAQAQPLIKRTIFKTDKIEFGPGGTITLIGAPKGSITIIGEPRRDIDISAEIEIQAATEDDLNQLSAVSGFVTEEAIGSISVISVGTYDKKYLKRVTKKKLPKRLRGLPLRIDYVIKVPQYSDLDVNGGEGDFELSGVNGAIKLNLVKTKAKLNLVGGGLAATVASGDVDVFIPARSWSGRYLEINLASGNMNVSLPPGLNAQIDANVLRTGAVNNTYPNIKAERKQPFTPTSVVGKAGNGGLVMKFTVGDGTLNMFEMKPR